MRPRPVRVSQGAAEVESEGSMAAGSEGSMGSMGMRRSRFMLATAPEGDKLSSALGGKLLQSLQIVVL